MKINKCKRQTDNNKEHKRGDYNRQIPIFQKLKNPELAEKAEPPNGWIPN